jgi:1-acyl-sn-glycerol-3-phosphate acyltransferase
MKIIRVAYKLAVFIVTTPMTWLIITCGVPFVRIGGGSVPRWRALVFHLWARIIARTIGMRVTVKGDPPPSPFLLVANHLSYVDIVLLVSRMPCTFVARADLRDWPLFGPLVPAGGTLFLNRDLKRDIPRVIKQLKVPYEAGVGVVIFPEGTSSNGETVTRFRSSLLAPAASGRFPVYYASIRYETDPGQRPARESVCWWGKMEFLPHLIGLFVLPRFHAGLVFGKEPIISGDRKQLATELHEAVKSRFRPVSE